MPITDTDYRIGKLINRTESKYTIITMTGFFEGQYQEIPNEKQE